jgi:hypothetical protein
VSWINPWLHARLIGVSLILAFLVHVASGGSDIEQAVWVVFASICFVYSWTLILLAEFEELVAQEATRDDQ